MQGHCPWGSPPVAGRRLRVPSATGPLRLGAIFPWMSQLRGLGTLDLLGFRCHLRRLAAMVSFYFLLLAFLLLLNELFICVLCLHQAVLLIPSVGGRRHWANFPKY